MKIVQSKFDAETIYKVTDNAVTISRNGDEMKFPIYLIPVVANPLPLPQEIKDELFEFFDKKYPEVSCSICGKPMRQIGKRKYCSDECRKNAIAIQREAQASERRTAYQKAKTKKKISQCGEIERKARKIGLRYADIQKQETLAMVGRIKI